MRASIPLSYIFYEHKYFLNHSSNPSLFTNELCHNITLKLGEKESGCGDGKMKKKDKGRGGQEEEKGGRRDMETEVGMDGRRRGYK